MHTTLSYRRQSGSRCSTSTTAVPAPLAGSMLQKACSSAGVSVALG